VVWPPDLISDHSNFHQLGDALHTKLNALFDDAPYQVCIDEAALQGMTKRQVQDLAKTIASAIQSQAPGARTTKGLRGNTPIPWIFRRLSLTEVDENTPKQGVGLFAILPGFSGDFQTSLRTACLGFSQAFLKAAQNAAKKFCDYAAARKLFLVQFYGDAQVISDEDLLGVIKSANLPEEIDEVWYAVHDWVSHYDYTITWERAA
jgi:hypothetical protein